MMYCLLQAEDAAGQLGTAAKTVGTNMAQLLTAAAQVKKQQIIRLHANSSDC